MSQISKREEDFMVFASTVYMPIKQTRNVSVHQELWTKRTPQIMYPR